MKGQRVEEILQDLSQEALTRAIEANMEAFIPVFGLMGLACNDQPPGVLRAISHIPYSLFNSVMAARLDPSQADAAINAVIADGQARHSPLLWWTGPSTRPADLGHRLVSQGFALDETSPGMAVVLTELAERYLPQGLKIRRVEDSVDFHTWCQTMTEGFEIPSSADYVGEAWYGLLCKADPAVVRAYLGLIEGRPVATCLLFLAAGVAGIYSVSTVPSARGKGIGRALTQMPLAEARSLGWKVGILQSSEMGFNVYRSLGFREYCRIDCYRWTPS